jgi:hypothetical protein
MPFPIFNSTINLHIGIKMRKYVHALIMHNKIKGRQFMFELLKSIEKTRKHLQYLLTKKNNLLDPEVINISTTLDELLNRYYNLKALTKA